MALDVFFPVAFSGAASFSLALWPLSPFLAHLPRGARCFPSPGLDLFAPKFFHGFSRSPFVGPLAKGPPVP